ncbi:hypothetical protein [Bifidobacterium longum]|uniref:hypothetical protein n=1 Tax=Bifidobacterium longum TaxID=216816 RepID=UPI0010EAF56D|nr:hypothetical protein [Bifidobacterium longum]TCE49965.1 hypothetical protein MCC10047_1054 [Bifidobacterium longum subsp. longum]
MGALSITGIKPGSTSLKLTAGKITKTVPITVLSRNLLSYGPAEGNGLTATVNTDGSLHVTGAAARQWAGLVWTFPCPVQGTVILHSPTFIAGLSTSVKFLDAKGHQLGGQVISGGNAVAITAGTVSLRFEILSSEATPTAKDGDLRVQLESGDTAHEWMRPDNTSLRGGGELANLYPRVTGLPKTLGTDPGVMVTEPSPGTYRFKGSTTQKVDSWDSLTSSVHVDAGTYTMDATDWPLGNKSWLMGIQAHISHDDGSEGATVFEPSNYGPKTLKTGTLQCTIFVNTTGEVDKTFTPRLYKID